MRKIKFEGKQKWIEIPFVDKKYELSEFGDLVSYCHSKDGKELMGRRNRNGLVLDDLTVEGARTGMVRARLLYCVFRNVSYFDSSLNGMVVVKKDKSVWQIGDHYTGLELITKSEAATIVYIRNPGVEKSARKLTQEQRKEIRSEMYENWPHTKVALRYPVCAMTIGRVRNR